MTKDRLKRLLQMAQSPNHNHQRHYKEYCLLMHKGYVGWQLGFAYLLPQGEYKLKELTNGD